MCRDPKWKSVDDHLDWNGEYIAWWASAKLWWVLFDSFSMFSNFYLLHLHKQTCEVTLKNLPWSISKKRIENQTFPDLVMVIGEVQVIVDSFLLSVELILIFEDEFECLWNIVMCLSLWSCVLRSSPSHTPIKYRRPIEKRKTKQHPQSLMHVLKSFIQWPPSCG